MVKFDNDLTVENGVVIASGPVDTSKEKIVELCAWVFQRHGNNDAAVTEMTHQDDAGHLHLLRDHHLQGDGELKVDKDKQKWTMKLAKIGKNPMTPGEEAFAVAVALIEDMQSGDQQVIWWGHPVRLGA
jgi:hypothetical protein